MMLPFKWSTPRLSAFTSTPLASPATVGSENWAQRQVKRGDYASADDLRQAARLIRDLINRASYGPFPPESKDSTTAQLFAAANRRRVRQAVGLFRDFITKASRSS